VSRVPFALFELYALRTRGLLRALLRVLFTLRGAVMTLLALGLLAVGFGPALALAMRHGQPPAWGAAAVQETMPLSLLGLWLVNLLTPSGEAVLYFSPPEIDFLFQAPFSRKQLLVYKLIGFVTSALLLAAPVSLWVSMFASSWLCTWCGLALAVFWLNGLTLCVELLALIAAARGLVKGRALAALVLAVLVLAGLLQSYAHVSDLSWAELTHQFRESALGSALLSPLLVFAKLVTATNAAEVFGWGALALCIVLVTYVVAFSLDANYLEAAVAVSRRVQARMSRATGGMLLASEVTRGSALLSLPWLAGLGPVVSLQLGLLRRATRALVIVVALGIILSALFVLMNDGRGDQGAPVAALGVLCYATFIFSAHLPLAFRGDPRHIELLKQLPLRPSAVVGGQLAAVCAAISVFHFGVLLVVIAVLPESATLLLTAAVFSPPFNLLVLGLENLVFLFFPSSAPVAGSAGAANAGRMLAVTSFKLLVSAVVTGVALGLALSVRLFRGSASLAVGVAFCVVALAAALVTLAATHRFRKLDVSLDVIE
jgi:hypothetical protein